MARAFLLVLAGLGTVRFLTSKRAEPQITSSPSGNYLVYGPGVDSIQIPTVPNERGKWLFAVNCDACHRPGRDCDVLQIATVEDRVRDRALLREWIRNSDSVLKTGNPYFTKRFEVWQKAPMPAFPHLSDADIDAILEYVRGGGD